MQAVRTGLNAKAQGDTGRVMVVLLTDGRANVSLAKSNEDPEALAEGAPKATKVGLHASGIAAVCTGSVFIPLASSALGFLPLHLPFLWPWVCPALAG